ncbi:dihydropteroate synthase [Mangrovimonas sp. AS39]|uniref:dihydropteroate synthase n=1 Tax=Mangrovimonas futianensis TaxID=2895523 RepID=UPI001E3BBA1B|nr:dihydropteroate synthase [Mangrovimonas futianensis]MCF1191525.1 dihydropteroate synthase [Mangrovimonas futianensis]MCF1195220.1 dihydropteroate synthase [Mangrovimonas futianensis]
MTINCKGNLIDLSTPKVMGILNVTPDSFFDGGKYKSESDILSQVEAMLEQGTTFIDLGAYSSRPNANFVSETEELQKSVPIVELLIKEFPQILISIDTFRSEVAKNCIEAGAAVVNDISAGHLDDQMIEMVGNLKVPYIMMHMRGTPQTMQQMTSYDDLLKEMIYYFSERIQLAKSKGIVDMIIDPGFGFAKSTKQNFELLNKLELLNIIDKPLLVGVSRKSMIYKTLETSVDQALNGTTSINTISLLKGAKILRVHDVKEAIETVKLFNEMISN